MTTRVGQPQEKFFLVIAAIATGAISSFCGDALTKLLLENSQPGVAAVVALLAFAGGAGATIYYWTIFGYGGYPKKSSQRTRYNRLRRTLLAGGRVGPIYERMLRAVLGAVDRLFDDRDEPTLFPRAFGLRERAPLWTAVSYDKCLVIALLYPVVAIILVWTASGHIGPAEAALSLAPGMSVVERGARFLAIAVPALFLYLSLTSRSLSGWVFYLVASIAAAVFILLANINISIPVVICSATLSIVVAGEFSGITLTAVILSCTVLSPLIAGALLDAGWGRWIIWPIVASVTAGGWGVSWLLERLFGRLGMKGLLLVILSAIALGIAYALTPSMASKIYWSFTGPITLFLIVLTIVNAPFDWLTLGLTRALLRRGLELGGWWPLVFGLFDLISAVVVVVALAVATLWAVQLFGYLTLLGGGPAVLDATAVLKAIGDPSLRGAPEYWWLYAMLFATLVPSIVNVGLGALSLLRGVPGLHQGLARRMPVGKAVLESERMWMAPVLAFQAMLSNVAGFAVMLGLIVVILGWLLPIFGINLIPLLQVLAEEDLPGRALSALGVR